MKRGRSFPVDKSNVTIRTEAGHEFTLNSDHVRGYTSGSKPYLTFLVQIFIQGAEIYALPGPFPGAAVLPRIDRARKARAFLPLNFNGRWRVR